MRRVKFCPASIRLLLGISAILFATAAFGQQLTWDPNGNGGATSASGNWDASTANWWNGSADAPWPQTSGTAALAGAVFGGGDGSYNITLDLSEIAYTNLTVNNSGYTFYGQPLYGAGPSTVVIAAGKAVTFNSELTGAGNGSEYFECGNNAVVNILGGATGGQQPQFQSTNNSATFYLSGAFGYNVTWVEATVYQTNGSYTPNGFFCGRTANGGLGNIASNGTWIATGPATTFTMAGANLMVARGGAHGTFIMSNGVTVATAASTISGQNDNLVLVDDNGNGNQAVFDVYGGTLTVGQSTSTTGGVIEMIPSGAGSSASATFNQTNGTVNAWGGIFFGENSSAAYTGSVANLANSGGFLYIGPDGPNGGGINKGAYFPPTINITFSGGIVGALGDWSSPLPVTLGTLDGNVTFQTADSNGDPWNISLSGVLSGTGGFYKTGAGTLTLSGSNTYTGATAVSNGTLAVTTASTGAGSYSLAGGSTLSEQLAAAGNSLAMSSLSLASGSTLELNAGSFANPTAPMVSVSGAVTPSGAVNIDVSGEALTNGQFTLIKYGSLGGAGFNAFVLQSVSLSTGVSATASLVNNTTNRSIDLSLTTAPAAQLVWDGTNNGNWDIGLTPNWKTNAYYTQTVSGGPIVVFGDTAAGPYTAIILNTNVSPSGVVVSNSVLSYSISGSGGIDGEGALSKAGSGTLTLGGNNTYGGGTTITGGILALTTTNNVAMPYTNTGGTLSVTTASQTDSLAMTSLAFGSNSPQLTFSLYGFSGADIPVIDDTGNLAMNGNVAVNVAQPIVGTTVLLQYAGTRSGGGSFVAGAVPANATIVDNLASKTVSLVYSVQPSLVKPIFNTNEMVVAVATPQDYGAKGDGVTDDSAAFQSAMNAVYNSGGAGGGVVFVPAASYAFYNSITIPTGVTLHGDWTDWTKGTNGLVGTTFNVYYGAGQSNAVPFINMEGSTALRDVNIWYPNQSPASIVAYPFTIGVGGDDVVQNVVLVNSYQGIQVNGAEFILSTVIGTPLFMGFTTVGTIADISQTEDIRFSPAVWPASLLPGSPAAGSSYATWMRTYGTGMQVFRLDGLINVNTAISGYNVGLDFEENSGGQAGCAFYNGWVTNCATALLAQEMQTAEGLEISDFTLDGDTAISRTHTTNDAAAEFDNCQIIGRNGTAVYCTGADWQSSMAFQNCTISNALNLAGPGVFNLVNCRLSGSTQCVISASATRVAFTGCAFSPATNIVNNGNSSGTNLLIHSGSSISNAMPMVDWTNVMNDFASRQPARTNLYVATSYGATGNGVTDDTVALQNALAAAGANGGGLVYLPPGKYHVTNTLDVPGGVELRGAYETRHSTGPGPDGMAKGAILQPYGGQGTTNGPPAIALEANAGLVGMTISYESQWSNCFPFPPTVQGRGANVYIIGVQCPNPYYYVDLDTYTCTNHFIDMLDGWALKTGVHVGNGSSGSIVDCHYNWTFWIDNSDSASYLQGAAQAPVNGFTMSNLQFYVLGNCTELFVKDFSIIENMYMHCSAENGQGPNVTAISAMCDSTYQCFVFDSTAPCTFNDVNPEWLVSLNGGYSGLTNQAALLSTSNFQGTVRFFNSPIWGSHNWDYIVNGGDIGFELVHLWQYADAGTQVNGGVFHLINCGAFNVVDGGSGYPPYNLEFGPNAGIAGKTNEVIGCFSYSGWNVDNNNVTDPANVWMDYALSSYSVLNNGPVVIGNVYPDGLYQFESSSALTFMAYSANGINSNGITVQLAATNLLGQGYVTNLNAANGLAVSGSSTTKSVGAPLAANALYTVVIQVTDADGNQATNTVSFDTISPASTFEAEDFDYNSGDYINNPQTDAYAGLSGTAGIDFSNGIPGQGSANYRPQGLETEDASDKPRLAYSGGLQDYDVGFANNGNWGNYTRAFPAGVYNIYMRAASPNGPTTDSASMSLVTAGRGTTNQTVSKLGTFSVPNTGSWQTYTWVPLKSSNGSFATFNGGSVETLRGTTANGGYNVNFYMLVTTNIQAPWVVSPAAPTGVTAVPGNAQITLSWTASPDATSYDVMRSTTNGGPYVVIASNVGSPRYTDAGLINGTNYYYVISSVSALGESPDSAQVSASPIAPIALNASLPSNGQIRLSWTTNDDGGTFSLYYSSNLISTTWVPVTNAPMLSNNQWNVVLPIGTNSAGFYRLQE